MRIYIEGASPAERLALASFIKDHLGRLHDVSGHRSNAEYLVPHTWTIKSLAEVRRTAIVPHSWIVLAEEGEILNAI